MPSSLYYHSSAIITSYIFWHIKVNTPYSLISFNAETLRPSCVSWERAQHNVYNNTDTWLAHLLHHYCSGLISAHECHTLRFFSCNKCKNSYSRLAVGAVKLLHFSLLPALVGKKYVYFEGTMNYICIWVSERSNISTTQTSPCPQLDTGIC